MSSTISDLGSRKVYPSGQNSTILVIPKQWVTEHAVRIHDTVYCVVGLTGDVRIYATNEGREEWAEPLTVRTYHQTRGRRYPAITVTANMTRLSGIAVGDKVKFSADLTDGALIIRKGE